MVVSRPISNQRAERTLSESEGVVEAPCACWQQVPVHLSVYPHHYVQLAFLTRHSLTAIR